MDFGIARLQSAEVTGSDAIVGTPTYMAPEQITNGAITPATDLFAVGCLLYELLSYQKPFEGETVHGVLYQVLTTDPKPLRTMAPSIPAALERVVAKAMNKVPEDRYETARQLQAALTSIRAALSGASEPTTRMALHWTPIPAAALRLVTHAPLKWRGPGVAAPSPLGAGLVLAVPPPPPGAPPASPGGRGARPRRWRALNRCLAPWITPWRSWPHSTPSKSASRRAWHRRARSPPTPARRSQCCCRTSSARCRASAWATCAC